MSGNLTTVDFFAAVTDDNVYKWSTVTFSSCAVVVVVVAVGSIIWCQCYTIIFEIF
jgi:hypothetical protein